jgi:hypothetical protein
MRLPADAAELFDLLDEFAPDWRDKNDPAGWVRLRRS